MIKGKRSDCNITPLLHPKLQRRITYERCESEVNIGGNWGAGHVSNGDAIVLKVCQWGARARRGVRAWIAVMDMGIFGNHLLRARRWDRMGLRGG